MALGRMHTGERSSASSAAPNADRAHGAHGSMRMVPLTALRGTHGIAQRIDLHAAHGLLTVMRTVCAHGYAHGAHGHLRAIDLALLTVCSRCARMVPPYPPYAHTHAREALAVRARPSRRAARSLKGRAITRQRRVSLPLSSGRVIREGGVKSRGPSTSDHSSSNSRKFYGRPKV